MAYIMKCISLANDMLMKQLSALFMVDICLTQNHNGNIICKK